MGEKQDELEQLDAEFTDETSELKELEEKLAVHNTNNFYLILSNETTSTNPAPP